MNKHSNINELGAAKTHMALGKIKKQLDEPVVGIGKIISAIQRSQDVDVTGDGKVDDQDKKVLDDLMTQLNNIVAYVGGAGSDILNLNASLRKNRAAVTAIDANLEEKVLRGILRELIKEELKRSR